MKIQLLTFFLIACFLSGVQAQDPQFVQFYAAPLQLNPAMTGVFPGKWRIVANYREQWNSILDSNPFRSMSASFDARSRVGRGDYFAYGVTALRDQAGSSHYLRTAGDLSLSYMKQLGGGYRSADQFLIGGAQVGFGQHTIDYQNLWFSAQFDGALEQVDRTRDNMETINNSSDLYLNVNAGLLWYAVYDDNQSLYLGGSLHHVNAPKVSFIAADGEEDMDMKWVVHGGGELPFSHEFSMLPAVAIMGQGPSLLSLFGTNIRYTNRDWRELALRAGAWGHLSKDVTGSIYMPAITFTAVLELERLNIGISYDVNVNKLSPPTNNRGAYEISLIYYQPASKRENVNCPKL